MHKTHLTAWLALPSLAALLLAGCGVAPGPATVTIAKGDLVQSVHAAASTASSSQAKLGFKTGGRIAKVFVATGDQVQEGQILAQLDTSDLDVAVQQAQAARDVANAAVAGAQARVQQLLASAKQENITQAQAADDSARQKLNDMLAGGRPESVAQAQAQVDAAQAKLQQVQSGSRQEQVQQAQAAVDAATAKLQALQNGPRPEQVAVLQKQIDAAKNSLFAAQTTRDGNCNPRNPDYVCQAGQAQVNAAQTSVDAAQKQYELATAPPTSTDLQAAQAGVDQAKAQLALLQNGGTQQDVQMAQDAVTQAQQALALAKSPYTGAQIQQARDAVTQADASVSLAQHPFTDADVAVAQAAVQQAQAAAAQADAAVSAAQNTLSYATLKAPSAGRVQQVNNVAGEIVSASSVVLVLGVGPTVLNASLPETAAGKVQTGQTTDVSFDSLPGQTFTGKVTDVAPASNSSAITYLATITLDKLTDAIHIGMNADVSIYTAREQGVLLVPNQALQSYQGKQIVSVVGSDGQPKTAEVQTGLADAQNSEVLSGLTEGQHVLLSGLAPAAAAPAGSN
ncbi:MAG TPA: efflux RND transporter periplasmic adaptor subunit [Chloroflexota bacterium]|nr:efflux RND transporter periplasmic adaptor subunit [Chloroflexota bacterium]